VEDTFDAVIGENSGYSLQASDNKYEDPSRLKLMECVAKMEEH